MFLRNVASFQTVHARRTACAAPGRSPLQRPPGRGLPMSASLAVLLLAVNAYNESFQ